MQFLALRVGEQCRIVGSLASAGGQGVGEPREPGGETEAELKAVRRSVVRGTPFGAAPWLQRTARRLCLDSTLRSRGRPKKEATQNP